MHPLRELLHTAVRQHIAPNTAVLLSGGIDSSTVAHYAPELPRFTGYYKGEQYDERRYARLVAGPNHHEILITPDDFVQHFDNMIADITPPYEGPGTFGQWMVAKHVAANGITKVLTGEGGDELFGGYARLYMVAGMKPPDGYENYRLPDDYPSDLDEALEYEFHVGLPALLRVDEQVNSAHGIKAVPPMLNRRVVEWVQAQPAEQRVGKVLLKEAMSGLLPSQILHRTDKMGFPVPYVEWAQAEPVRSFVKDRIGYTPARAQPWDRGWWLDMCQASAQAVAA